MSVSEQPSDQYNVVYLLHFLLGAGMLWPYNTYVGVPGFLDDIYPGENVEFEVPMFLNYSSIVVMMLMVRYGHRVSFSMRILLCFSLTALGLAIVPVITNIDAIAVKTSRDLFLTVVFCNGVISAVLQSSIFGFSSILPSRYTQAVMGGNGIAGLFVATLRLVTKACFPDTNLGLRNSTSVFFLISAAFTLLCVGVYLMVVKHPFTQFHISRHELLTNTDSSDTSDIPPDDENVQLILPNVTDLLNSPLHFRQLAEIEARLPREATESFQVTQVGYGKVLRKSAYIGIVVGSIFTLTFMLFPGFISTLRSSAGMSSQWFAPLLILTFNAWDLVGRLIPGFFVLCGPDQLWIPALLRWSLYPLFWLRAHEVCFSHDVWIYIFTGLLGISNGYFASLGMMSASSYVQTQEREAQGYVMTVFLMGGILLGSHIAMLAHSLHFA